MASRRDPRQLIFIGITLACLVAALLYVWQAARNNRLLAETPTVQSPVSVLATSPLSTTQGLRQPVVQPAQVVGLNQTSSADLGKVEVAALHAPEQPTFISNLRCERVYYAAQQGICLTREIQFTTANTTATLFGPDFQKRFTFTTPGIPSRARISPDGRYAALTVFVLGHSYADAQMSTATFLLDTATGAALANLEEFAIWHNGKLLQAPDINFWGMTFTHDSNFFYATLRTGGQTYLVRGDIKAKKVTTLHENVECPSLSPDETRVAFKKLIARAQWRLTVLDLKTMVETPLAETNSVDDQAEWLDNGHVLYAAVDPNPPPWMSVMVVAADGSGQPQVFAHGLSSPAVIR